MPSTTEIQSILDNIIDPEFGRSWKDLNLISSLDFQDPQLFVKLQLPTPAYPNQSNLVDLIKSRAEPMGLSPENINVSINWEVTGQDSGGSVGLRVKNVIAVGSGKGGVGKSTVAASLAYCLKSSGAAVGLLDADVYGPSIPHMTGVEGEPAMAERRNTDGGIIHRIQPVDADGMPMMSIGFMIPEGEAVIWRGPMLHKLLTQFVKDTDWGELDYLIVDMPPGTGDVALTLSQMLSLAGAVVVCSPQKVALLDAVKAVAMYRKVNIPILGMVENMTGDIFGRGGAKQAAEELGIPFLGEIPMNAHLRELGDEGRISAVSEVNDDDGSALMRVAERMAIEIAKQLVTKPKAPTLEVLQ